MVQSKGPYLVHKFGRLPNDLAINISSLDPEFYQASVSRDDKIHDEQHYFSHFTAHYLLRVVIFKMHVFQLEGLN